MSEGKIVAEKEGYLGRIVFNNPAKHNAVSQAMWDGLSAAMQSFDADKEVRVVVLEGAGDRAFVSGADISRFESERANAERIRDYGESVNRAYASVQHAETPTIAKIRGYCFGGGMGIAVCCDLRICSDDSTFCIPAAKLGVGYGHQNTKVLMDLVGPAFTKEIFYTGRRFDAEEARMMGLVNRVLERSELDRFVQDYVETMSRNAPLSLRATNLIVNELLKEANDRDMSLCSQLVNDCSESEDIHEGRIAFMEKRPPAFKGR
jgi:enoyl-CoA hydratase/carnithine racemase